MQMCSNRINQNLRRAPTIPPNSRETCELYLDNESISFEANKSRVKGMKLHIGAYQLKSKPRIYPTVGLDPLMKNMIMNMHKIVLITFIFYQTADPMVGVYFLNH